jgi:hypothetical protein
MILLLVPLSACFSRADYQIEEEPTEVSFQVTGDYPYNGMTELHLVKEDISDFSQSNASFFVHVGDISNGGSDCTEERCIFMKERSIEASKPVFFVIGDNEWQDCPDMDLAREWWDTHLMYLDHFWDLPFSLERQAVRQENWAFTFHKVLFIGVSMPGGQRQEPNEQQRIYDNVDWITYQFDKVKARAVVLFGQTGKGQWSNDYFFDHLEALSLDYAKPVMYIRGDTHVYVFDQPYAHDNMWRFIVEQGGHESPATVTVDLDKDMPFEINRGVNRE